MSTEASFKPGGPFFGEFTSENLSQGFILCCPSLAYKGSGYTIFCTEPSICIVGIYGISSRTSNPDIHEFLLHTDTALQSYSLIECLEREVFDKRYTVYLYVVNLCTEFNRLCFLASYDRTYVIRVYNSLYIKHDIIHSIISQYQREIFRKTPMVARQTTTK